MQLEDSFKRQISYLRLSVTDHCNYNCFYCRTEEDAGSLSGEFLTSNEICKTVRIFTELGVQKIRLTGGEPLIRKDIEQIVKSLGKLPKLNSLSLSTNAHLLDKHARAFKQNGLSRVNISLDTLDNKRFSDITQGGNLDKVLKGIDAAIDAGLGPIKINMVVMQDRNVDEIESMLDFAIAKNIQLRFIETMPIGSAGQQALKQHYPADKILQRVQEHCQSSLIKQNSKFDAGPARIYTIKNTKVKVGVISALSQHFCDTCNRVRLTAKGRLILCLGQENSISLRDEIRADKSDEQIKQLITKTILKKPERHDFNTSTDNAINNQMVKLGG
ncbi:GTP 3',8-cyclase MoaA [Moraxella sp.]|uniref:GTP 3',8-cyclase MoaA n=1 Tax=Moraxella sp. TaxID=479 RepID=UPI002617209B|nr:GTP 3',8-cyclase MoaA [Moraxella sp.]MCP3897564.1 GTP 3',8-cyclase MoaA [Moraxella sp.]